MALTFLCLEAGGAANVKRMKVDGPMMMMILR